MDIRKPKTAFARRLIELREALDMKPHELAALSGIREARLRSWEKEGVMPTLHESLYRLAIVLQTTPTYLLFGVLETLPLPVQQGSQLVGSAP